MREIKFKAKREDNEEWIIGDLFRGYTKSTDYKEVGYSIAIMNKDQHFNSFEVLPETVCQYIGINDMDGNEYSIGDKGIFPNGDKFILKSEEWLEVFAEWVGEPECEDQTRDLYRIRNAKITGNIHDKK